MIVTTAFYSACEAGDDVYRWHKGYVIKEHTSSAPSGTKTNGGKQGTLTRKHKRGPEH